MAKRFTDKSKWDDEWYISLDNDCRIVWEYLLDRCDHAGVFKKNQRMINFCCNVNWDQEKLEEVFNGRIFDYVKFYFIPKYLKFQYPKGLNSKKPAIVSVRGILKEKELLGFVNELYGNDYLTITESLSNGYLTIKDKDKDKDKNKDTDKDKHSGFSLFEALLKAYPGTKREADTEFKYFRETHSDWQRSFDLLLPAIQKQIEWRRNSDLAWRPPWKNFKAWLSGRHWEDVLTSEGSDKDCDCGAAYVGGPDGHKYATDGKGAVIKGKYRCNKCRKAEKCNSKQ